MSITCLFLTFALQSHYQKGKKLSILDDLRCQSIADVFKIQGLRLMIRQRNINYCVE